MLVPAGSEPQPQQPATVPAASPRLLAHSQWAVLPALRKPSRRAAPQPRPGSAASRIAAGAAGWSGDAGAGGASVGQVGLKQGVTCAQACCPCEQDTCTLHRTCSVPCIQDLSQQPIAGYTAWPMGTAMCISASTPTAVPLKGSTTVTCHDRVGHLRWSMELAVPQQIVIPLCISGLQAGSPVQPEAPPAPSEAGSIRAGQLAAVTGSSGGNAGQHAGAAAQDGPAAQPAVSNPDVVPPPRAHVLREAVASARTAMPPQGQGSLQESAAAPPAMDKAGAAADQQQHGEQARLAETQAASELQAGKGPAQGGASSLAAGLGSGLPAPKASDTLLGLAATQEPQGSAAEPEGVRWELAGFSAPAASPTAGEQQQSPAAFAECLGGSSPDSLPQVSRNAMEDCSPSGSKLWQGTAPLAPRPPGGQVISHKTQLGQRRSRLTMSDEVVECEVLEYPGQADDSRPEEGHARRAEAAAAAGQPPVQSSGRPAQSTAARPASAPQGPPGQTLTETAAAWQQEQGVNRSGQGPRPRALQQQPGHSGLEHLAGRTPLQKRWATCTGSCGTPCCCTSGGPWAKPN